MKKEKNMDWHTAWVKHLVEQYIKNTICDQEMLLFVIWIEYYFGPGIFELGNANSCHWKYSGLKKRPSKLFWDGAQLNADCRVIVIRWALKLVDFTGLLNHKIKLSTNPSFKSFPCVN